MVYNCAVNENKAFYQKIREYCISKKDLFRKSKNSRIHPFRFIQTQTENNDELKKE